MRVHVIIFLIFLSGCSIQPKATLRPIDQIPSPKQDTVQSPARIEDRKATGVSIILKNDLSKPIDIYFDDHGHELRQADMLIHFHGFSDVPQYAVNNSKQPFILAVINLGIGSAVYENAFQNGAAFPELIEKILDSVSAIKNTEIKASRIYLSSFSAGYGAVRAILKHHQSFIDGIVLLDGLHTDYVPAGRKLSQGGTLNVEKLRDFVRYAQLAIDDKKKFLITHSEIFPGTYASTAETADFLICSLDLKRNHIVKSWPAGMRLLSETTVNGLTILGFSGNSARDHIDHFNGLPIFLKMIFDRPTVD